MEEEVSRFRSELLLRDARDICRRFLIFGSCTQLDDERYYGLKAAVAEEFAIDPQRESLLALRNWAFPLLQRKAI